MADNDRFVVGLVVKPKECNGCEYTFETCEVTCEHNIRKGKTRAEFEQMFYELAIKAVTAETLAKDICDRLFGEGEWNQV